MTPYTAEGIQERERSDNTSIETPSTTNSKNRHSLTLSTARSSANEYELVGVVVHSGQASAGHYYSFIKERKRQDNMNRNRWMKFNDTTVEEFEMNDNSLEAECFGGSYKAKGYDSSKHNFFVGFDCQNFLNIILFLFIANGFPETRQRYWNGYILFYDRIDEPLRTPRTPRKGVSSCSANTIVTRSSLTRSSFRSTAGSLSTTPSKLTSASVNSRL